MLEVVNSSLHQTCLQDQASSLCKSQTVVSWVKVEVAVNYFTRSLVYFYRCFVEQQQQREH